MTVLELCMNGITQDLLTLCLASFTQYDLRFTHVALFLTAYSFLLSSITSLWIYHSSSIYLVMDIWVVSIPKSELAESHIRRMFNFFINCQTFSKIVSCYILIIKCMKVPVPPYPCQHLMW